MEMGMMQDVINRTTPTGQTYVRNAGKQATCHPDKPAHMRGLCAPCYGRQLRARPESRASQITAGKRWLERNRKKAQAQQRAWWIKNRNCQRVTLRNKYGLTLEEFDLKGARQEGRCAICQEALAKPHVDHCHTTGQVRALLCFRCNAGLGSFNDNPAKMRRAATYIEYWSGVHQN